jgi:hypothetical protein
MTPQATVEKATVFVGNCLPVCVSSTQCFRRQKINQNARYRAGGSVALRNTAAKRLRARSETG